VKRTFSRNYLSIAVFPIAIVSFSVNFIHCLRSYLVSKPVFVFQNVQYYSPAKITLSDFVTFYLNYLENNVAASETEDFNDVKVTNETDTIANVATS
jgi:hypothetical protein